MNIKFSCICQKSSNAEYCDATILKVNQIMRIGCQVLGKLVLILGCLILNNTD